MVIPQNVYSELKVLMDYYVQHGIISKDKAYDELYNSQDYEKVIEKLRCFIDLDDKKEDKIFRHLRKNIYKGVMTREERDTILNQEEQVLLQKIIENRGILARTSCVNVILPTRYVCDDTTVPNLKEMGIIDSFKVGKNTFYVLNIQFYREVMKHVV